MNMNNNGKFSLVNKIKEEKQQRFRSSSVVVVLRSCGGEWSGRFEELWGGVEWSF